MSWFVFLGGQTYLLFLNFVSKTQNRLLSFKSALTYFRNGTYNMESLKIFEFENKNMYNLKSQICKQYPSEQN